MRLLCWRRAETTLFFGEVPDKVAAEFVVFRHDVEEKGFDVVVEGLGAEEEFREETKVLTVERVPPTVNFEER